MFFSKRTECPHERVNPQFDSQYCPDCGKYVENKWYMTRCSCCNVKRKAIIKQKTIQPHTKFCPNCGAQEFHVEPIASINFIDINFAVLIKEADDFSAPAKNQVWVERENHEPMKLLGFNCLRRV